MAVKPNELPDMTLCDRIRISWTKVKKHFLVPMPNLILPDMTLCDRITLSGAKVKKHFVVPIPNPVAWR